ncbi:quinohemoprotein amine dehydrogenase subunit beta [Isoalcanivorax beigongshangi]|uniref:Quinohemoprotein amine dehydrogenase subunit beta n=1 Tax=Isoalcanivorax beigongshangi TaxID=3238810 RepID=A0ABV4AJX0_9GAMM
MLKNKKIAAVALTALLTLGSAAATAADTSARKLIRGHEYLAIANAPSNLTVIDVKTDKVFKECEMPDRFGPGTMFISPDKTRAYVLNNHFTTVYGVELDTCKTVFKADLNINPGERVRSMFSFTVSADGKEIYAVANPTKVNLDHYVVQQPRLQVYSTDAGLDAKPIRVFPAPRQLYIMQAADDGSLFVAGPDFYKVNVQTGEFTKVLDGRSWDRPGYSDPDVLYFWPNQQPNRDFSILWTAAKYNDDSESLDNAEFKYGFFNMNMKTGETETVEFATLTEVYFTGLRSQHDRNIMYGVLNRLTKYDIAKQELLAAQELDHTYYAIALSHDGKKIYLAGTFNDIGVHDADTLAKIARIDLPGGDMGIANPQVFIR